MTTETESELYMAQLEIAYRNERIKAKNAVIEKLAIALEETELLNKSKPKSRWPDEGRITEVYYEKFKNKDWSVAFLSGWQAGFNEAVDWLRSEIVESRRVID